MQRLISVIIPTYNSEEYLSGCLDSVLSQTLENIEILCVDDASTDSSRRILEEYSKKNNKIRVFFQKKSGPGVARNLGIRNAKGKYICMMDADDYYPSDTVLEKLYLLAEEKAALICGGNIIDVFPDGTTLPTPLNFQEEGFLKSMQYPRLYGQTRFIYNRSFIVDNHIEYLPYIRFEDPPFVLEAIMRAQKYYVIKDYTYVRRAGYKGVNTNKDIAKGILYGIIRCTEVAKEFGLEKLYKEQIAKVMFSSIDYLHSFFYAGNQEIWNVVNEVINSAGKWYPDYFWMFSSPEDYQRYIGDVANQVTLIKSLNNIIIYGAGKVAERLIDTGWLDVSEIVGVGVTGTPSVEMFQGIRINRIDEVIKSVNADCVIIAASEANAEEMKNVLENNKWEKYLIVTANTLNVAKLIGM